MMEAASDVAIIRTAAPGDIPAIAAIYAREVVHGTATFELEPPDVAEMERRRLAVLSAGCPYLVAEAAGAILGYAYAGPYRPRRAYRFTVENSVYVGAPARGRGVGRRLLGALIDQAAASGFRQMVAVIGDSENGASIGLHTALGFAPVGIFRSVGWKHGRWVDSVLMQRSLGPGDGEPPDPGR